MKISLEKIIPNPEQPRRDFADLDSLAQSIKEHGLINPIAVEQSGELYILIDGERRWRAAKMAGLKEIEAFVKPALNGGGQQERLLLAMIANLQREDVNPIEEATGYKHMMEMGIKVAQIAKMVDKSPGKIYYYLDLLSFETEIQALFARRRIPISNQVISQMLALPDDIRVPLAQGFARRGSTISAILYTCKRMQNKRGSEEKVEGDFGPGLNLAYKHAKTRKMIGQWNALSQSKNVPPWKIIQATALETCLRCPISDMASESNCKDCPLVDFLKILMEGKA
jgi:ParB/RepB/Spo0J family partition protein